MTVYTPKAKIALASSFEGIVNNGATECALTSLNAYQRMYPGLESFFSRVVEAREFGAFADSQTVAGFVALRQLVEIAEDYHTVLRLMDTYPDKITELLNDPTNISLYEFFIDRFSAIKATTAEERKRFGTGKQSEFYRERARMQEVDYRAWMGTQRPYPNSIREMRKLIETQIRDGDEVHKVLRSGFVPWFATSKDEESAFDLCRLYSDLGLLDPRDVSEHDSGVCVISRERIIGLETTRDKIGQVKMIAEREGLPPSQVFRVNDRYDPKQQTQLADSGFGHQIMVTGGYVFPHDVQKARNDPLVKVVERDNMAEEISRLAQRWGF